jgi:selenide,water dikinase
VTGTINPARVFANDGAKPGDALVLTKTLGTGVISTAIKRGEAQQEWIDCAVDSMTTLNKVAAEVLLDPRFKVHTATDVTGFGLVGHAREIALASNVSVEIETSKLAFLPGAIECVRAGAIPGGLKANREFAEDCMESARGLTPEVYTLLFDPQTAGGLLISVESSGADALVHELQARRVPAGRIGHVMPRMGKPIQIL